MYIYSAPVPRDLALAEVVYIFRCPNIVSLKVVSDPVSGNRNQGYNSCIHDCWAMIKDTCYTRHHGNAKTTPILGLSNELRCAEPSIHILGTYGVHTRVFLLAGLCRA